jgi:hypothetical protein
MQIKKTLKPPSPSLPTLRERLEPATQFPRRTLFGSSVSKKHPVASPKNERFWDSFLSSLKGGVYGISYCFKSRLRITVSIFVGVFGF